MRVALLCLLLSACAIMRGDQDRHSPFAIYDAYLIAHGMAESYDERQDADPVVMKQLSTLDMRAHRALIDLARAPDGNADATARAVAALSDNDARQTSSPQ
jgi:hypothetical protein